MKSEWNLKEHQHICTKSDKENNQSIIIEKKASSLCMKWNSICLFIQMCCISFVLFGIRMCADEWLHTVKILCGRSFWKWYKTQDKWYESEYLNVEGFGSCQMRIKPTWIKEKAKLTISHWILRSKCQMLYPSSGKKQYFLLCRLCFFCSFFYFLYTFVTVNCICFHSFFRSFSRKYCL